jgi:hypothetical protein
MKHTTKLLTVLATVIAVFSLTGCPKPVGEIDDEPIEVVHEHSWGEGVITTEPTCTNKGVRTFTCECGEKRTEEIAPLGHDFQGGYCERCGEYEFEDGYKLTFYVCTLEKYSSIYNRRIASKSSNTDIWKEVLFSFPLNTDLFHVEEEEFYNDKLEIFENVITISEFKIKEILQLKTDYKNSVIKKLQLDSSEDMPNSDNLEGFNYGQVIYIVIE